MICHLICLGVISTLGHQMSLLRLGLGIDLPVDLPPAWPNLNTLCISCYASQKSVHFYGRPIIQITNIVHIHLKIHSIYYTYTFLYIPKNNNIYHHQLYHHLHPAVFLLLHTIHYSHLLFMKVSYKDRSIYTDMSSMLSVLPYFVCSGLDQSKTRMNRNS